MSARDLLEDLRRRDVSLEIEGDRLIVEAPPGTDVEKLRAALSKHKSMLLKLLRWERRGTERTSRRGLEIGWSEYPVWIRLRDPATGEWHEVRASDCFKSVVEEANAKSRRGRGAS